MRATPTRKRFGEQVRRLRKAAGLSQEELGFRAGIHRTYIGAVERGEQNISVDSIHKLAKALKIQPSRLFTDNNK